MRHQCDPRTPSVAVAHLVLVGHEAASVPHRRIDSPSALVGRRGRARCKRKVRVTHYGYPGDPTATRLTRLGLGDHNNILNQDSVAVSPDLNAIFPFGSRVLINGKFLGLRHDTTNAKWRNTIAIYDADGEFHGDFEAYIDVPRKK